MPLRISHAKTPSRKVLFLCLSVFLLVCSGSFFLASLRLGVRPPLAQPLGQPPDPRPDLGAGEAQAFLIARAVAGCAAVHGLLLVGGAFDARVFEREEEAGGVLGDAGEDQVERRAADEADGDERVAQRALDGAM
ncbi:MAG: hypothetical protein HY719_10175, partial [Planctomycetes bacterium]|nr:hypothetical protein [Planctomycetota bacterium]